MADSNWSLSSSSEDDEDAHFFQSKVREGSVYYEKFLKEDYGTDVWEDHIPRFKNLGLNNNHSPTFANISTNSNGKMANALHLSCSVPDRIMVLNRDTNQYEVMRYVEIANGAVITPEAEVNLPDSTMNGSTASASSSAAFLNNSFNVSCFFFFFFLMKISERFGIKFSITAIDVTKIASKNQRRYQIQTKSAQNETYSAGNC